MTNKIKRKIRDLIKELIFAYAVSFILLCLLYLAFDIFIFWGTNKILINIFSIETIKFVTLASLLTSVFIILLLNAINFAFNIIIAVHKKIKKKLSKKDD